ncbi:hypothetical protein AC579_4946 [Pseudocercospora musae]|uniref:Mmc1 C-terminal domain-containing protein n=1 Tax=Pseudocercospora musae TaxID=113226 RepID=A0A139I979_9PEZI|nr:hypothetical protein AC579_4946 [Pseudocercospora musae]
MPTRASLSLRATRILQSEPYVCPSCLTKSRAGFPRKEHGVTWKQIRINSTFHTSEPKRRAQISPIKLTRPRRHVSTGSLASTTAINAPTNTPNALRELHRQLLLLQGKASSYVDLSRLQLALRSLESADPVIRVAFLGLGASGAKAARKLARVLLADALSDEEAWEKELVDSDDGRSVLLKYGETLVDRGVQPTNNPLVRELLIPSPMLKRWNAEILVTGINTSGLAGGGHNVKELEDSMIVPSLTISNAGRVGFVRYPVHRAVVVGEGVTGAVDFGRLPSILTSGTQISAALSLPLRQDRPPQTEIDGHEVDIPLAEHALAVFRTNKANGAIFSSEWQTSRVGKVGSWIASSGKPNGLESLKPAVKDLLTSILSRAKSSIASASSAAEASSTSLTVPDAKRQSLLSAISAWSEEAHRDLQMNLSAALRSPTWRRTTWWRLFYRIDEVSISASDVLRRGWLAEAEQNLAFLSGRVLEAGLASVEELKGAATAAQVKNGSVKGLLDEDAWDEVEKWKARQVEDAPSRNLETVAELMQVPPLLSKIRENTGLNAFFDPPWPQTIQFSRQHMLHQLVPAMHLKAQKLMLASLSTITGTGALGAWLWVASGGVALYEGGAIAALGLVWALRRLQKKWTKERGDFVQTAHEDARRVLRDVESRLGALVREGGRVVMYRRLLMELQADDDEMAKQMVAHHRKANVFTSAPYSSVLMAGRYTYGEQVARRANTASEFTPPARAPISRTSRTRQRSASIPLAEWEQIHMIEQAIQHFETRFEEFMRSQSRLLEDILLELETVKAAMRKLEAKMKRLEGYAKHLDTTELTDRIETMRLEESALRNLEDKFAGLEPLLESREKFAERMTGVEAAIEELRTAVARIEIRGPAQHFGSHEDAERGAQHSDSGDETPAAPTRGRTALEAFFYALDHFGETLNGFENHETQSL